MELNEIVALLETQFPGVRKDGLNQLARVIAMQVNTKEEATGIVGKLTAEAVAKFVADWRKDADAEIDKANKTREDNLRKKYDFVEKKPEEGGTDIRRLPYLSDKDVKRLKKYLRAYKQLIGEPTYSVYACRQEYPNAYMPWTKEDDLILTRMWNEGATNKELSSHFQRKPGAIRSRVEKLGLEKLYGERVKSSMVCKEEVKSE